MEDSSGEVQCNHNKLHRKQVERAEPWAEDMEMEVEFRRKNRWSTPRTEQRRAE